MNIQSVKKLFAVSEVASLCLVASNVLAQPSSTPTTAATTAPAAAQPAAASQPAPQLSYGVSEVVQLAHANVGDDTIIAYIKSSGNSYGLDVDQIIYLRQQGVSEAVITTMLSQPRPGVAVVTPTTPAPLPVAATDYSGQAPPPVTYDQTQPDTTYYYQPYYYPAYAWYPPVTFSFGWGGYYGGYRGGYYRGGWHGGGGVVHGGGGGWHGGGGGWHGGASSGGWHGGGSGGGWHGGGHH
jgi:hypothetical protein